ncbi:MAG: hypothetical protein D6702_04080 [Planctomycetota bacterium]|nr:MAG: hypothetical protein D6702_04080 [Planctomycetota bacterium]
MAADLHRRVEELQDPWLLPFRFVDLTPELSRAHWAVVEEDGTLSRPSGAYGAAEREVAAAGPPPGRRFAWAVAARVRGREHLLATDSFAEEPARRWLAGAAGDDAGWLLRIERRSDTVEVRLRRGPEPVLPRPPMPAAVDLLCDLGMVLCRFERAAFARHFRVVYGRELPAAAAAWIAERRPAFEAGDLDEDAFAAGLLPRLGLAPPDRPAIERLWGSIFSPKRSTVAFLRALAAHPGVELVVVSNTDPWALRGCRELLGLEDLLEGAAASFQPGVRPKGEGDSLWRRARAVAAARRGAAADLVVAVDDVRSYLHQARRGGAADAVVHYRGYPQLRFELERLGLRTG